MTDPALQQYGQALMGMPVPVKLNLGSFVDWTRSPGWLHIDILPLEERAKAAGVQFKRWDLRQGMPWQPTASVDVLHMSHLIEHLTIEEGKNLLREIHRALKPGGRARIATPDLDILVQRYRSRDMAYFNRVQPKEYIEAKTDGEKLSRLLFGGTYEHRCVYTFEMLHDFLVQAGFVPENVLRMAGGYSNSAIMQQEVRDLHLEESLYVEALK